MAGTEKKRIIELTEASTVQSGDYFPIDSASRGTKKVPTDALATSAALTAETNARAGADEQMSERMDGIEEQTALIQNPTKTLSGALCSFTDGAEMPMVACTASIVPKQSGTGTPSPDNVRPISGWTEVNVIVSPTQEATDGTTTTTPLGRTVYGGEAEIVGGSLTDKMRMVDLGTLNWQYNGSSPYKWFYTSSLASTIKPIATNADKANILSPIYEVTTRVAVGADESKDYAIWVDREKFIGVRDSRYTSASDFKSAMSGVQLVYELAQPQTYTLTGQEISTLLGDNNVWADSGDVEITYRRDISIVLENLENALSGSNSLNTMMMSAPTENTAEEPTEDEAEDDMR